MGLLRRPFAWSAAMLIMVGCVDEPPVRPDLIPVLDERGLITYRYPGSEPAPPRDPAKASPAGLTPHHDPADHALRRELQQERARLEQARRSYEQSYDALRQQALAEQRRQQQELQRLHQEQQRQYAQEQQRRALAESLRLQREAQELDRALQRMRWQQEQQIYDRGP